MRVEPVFKANSLEFQAQFLRRVRYIPHEEHVVVKYSIDVPENGWIIKIFEKYLAVKGCIP
jgi:hypothetical protein